MPHTRRDFLQASAVGVGLLAAPRFLAGCGAKAGSTDAIAAASLPANPFLEWFAIDEARLGALIGELASNGADFADVYLQHARNTWITLEDGIVSQAYARIEQGAGLRTVKGDQTGYSFTEDLTHGAMLAAAKTAAAMGSGGAVAAPTRFQWSEPTGLYTLAVPWDDIGVGQKLPILQRVEALAKASEPSITKIQVSWSDGQERVLVADLSGHIHVETRPMTRLWCTITATRGDQTLSNSANLAGRQGFDFYTEERLQFLVDEAVQRTMVLFEARRPPAGELPVVLAAGASGILLHEAIGHGLEADFNRKGTSIYTDMMGKKVAPDLVTIVDSGVEPGERGALSFDDEGNPTEKTVLVENGVLASYLHDSISARHYGVRSTGSGRRESYKHAPMPRMRCTFMEDGPHTRDEIIQSVKLGIVAETFTNGQVQIGAGDYTFYIKNGWLIEDGKITAPIKDVNIIGNGPESLERVTMVANDGKLDYGGWTCGKNGQGVPVSQGLPTVLVSAMTVGGENG